MWKGKGPRRAKTILTKKKKTKKNKQTTVENLYCLNQTYYKATVVKTI